MPNTLTAPTPSAGLNKSMRPRLLGMEFGDGYEESTPDGVNTLLMDVDVAWNLLTPAAASAIDTFLRAEHGKRFYWMLPGEVAVRAWKCKEWNMVEDTTTTDIRAKFEEQPL